MLEKIPSSQPTFQVLTNEWHDTLRVSIFSELSQPQLERLFEKLTYHHLTPGAVIIRQGEPGDICYLIRSGKLAVTRTNSEGKQEYLATVGPGDLVGEVALLTGTTRNATIQAQESAELLGLHRKDLLEMMRQNRQVHQALGELVRYRGCPQRANHISVHHYRSRDGQDVYTLKDEKRGVYYRLSPQSMFLWSKVDGQSSVKELTRVFFEEYKIFAPEEVSQIITGLVDAGFLGGQVYRQETFQKDDNVSRLHNVLYSLVNWRITRTKGVDDFFDHLYRKGGYLFFTRPVQFFLAIFSLIGLALFCFETDRSVTKLFDTSPAMLLFLIPIYSLHLIFHEFGHALTTKAAGRHVKGVGLGFFWFCPVAFIDTSDMWLADKADRIKVNLAGIYINFMLAGIVSVISWFLAESLPIIVWQFALIGYVSVIANLNPLLEYDGYYTLTDLLEKPNLRCKALAWLGQAFPSAILSPVELWSHKLELVYSLSSILYIIAIVGMTIWTTTTFLYESLTVYLPSLAVTIFSLVIAGILVFSSITHLWKGLKPSALVSSPTQF